MEINKLHVFKHDNLSTDVAIRRYECIQFAQHQQLAQNSSSSLLLLQDDVQLAREGLAALRQRQRRRSRLVPWRLRIGRPGRMTERRRLMDFGCWLMTGLAPIRDCRVTGSGEALLDLDDCHMLLDGSIREARSARMHAFSSVSLRMRVGLDDDAASSLRSSCRFL